MSVLTLYIKAENKKAEARMSAEEGLFVGLLSESESWWAERDVYTVEQFKRWEFESVMSDLAKEAYGTRSACPDTSEMSLEELEATYDRLCEVAHENFLEEERQQAESVVTFEAAVTNLIETGASDRKTALRWLVDAEGDESGLNSYFEYCNNLPYGYLAEDRKIEEA